MSLFGETRATKELLREGWWGPIWSQPSRRSLSELVADQMLTAQEAAAMWTLVEHGQSLVVATGPSGAGKTTLLTSLLDALPLERLRYFARGVYQDKRELDLLPPGSAILVNEISPHLPIYCWGTALRSVVRRGFDGMQILATIHADSVAEIRSQLVTSPSEVPTCFLDRLGWAVFIVVDQSGNQVCRRVRSIERIGTPEIAQKAMLTFDPSAGVSPQIVSRRTVKIEQLARGRSSPARFEFAAAMREAAC
jgi:hypothetical protein